MMAGGPIYCSFCGKSNLEVETLVAGPSAFICNECLELCVDIVADMKRKEEDLRFGQPHHAPR